MQKQIDVKRYITEGWELFQPNMTNLVVATLIMVVVNLAANFIPFGGLVVGGPLIGGMFYVVMDMNAGEAFNPKRIFDGFTLKLVPLVLAGIVTGLFTGIASLALILPGILVFGWYIFTYLYIVDRDMDFWGAMEASRQFGFTNHVGIFLFALALCALNLLGLIALGVGLLVTIPISVCAVFKAYADLIGLAQDPKTSVGGSASVMDKPKMKITPKETPPPPPAKGK